MKEEEKIFLRTIDKNKPARLIEEKVSNNSSGLEIDGEHFPLNNHPVYLIASGKASVAMAGALKKKFSIDDEKSICIARENGSKNKQKQKIIYASHPYPDKKSEKAADKLIRFIQQIPKNAIVLFALSGGTSALVSKPADGISIEEIAKVNKLLLNSGASILEINGVRKHLSKIKGGQLLNYFHPNITLIDLVISVVPGDDLEIIGSGLAIPDSTTFQNAYQTLIKYDLWEKLPQPARDHIQKGLSSEVSETLKPGDEPVQKHHSFIIGSARKFAETMGEEALAAGYQPIIAEEYYNGSVERVINKIISDLNNKSDDGTPKAFIYYGESTLNITGGGKGGRNQAMALRAAVKIDGMENITWLSAGTDGIDGPTDAVGAIVDGNTIKKAKEKGFNIHKFIETNDSYHFHSKMNTLLKTGPTGNNLMDVVLVLSSES